MSTLLQNRMQGLSVYSLFKNENNHTNATKPLHRR